MRFLASKRTSKIFFTCDTLSCCRFIPAAFYVDTSPMPSSLAANHRTTGEVNPAPALASGDCRRFLGVCLFLRLPLSRPCLFTHELGLPAIDVCRDLPF